MSKNNTNNAAFEQGVNEREGESTTFGGAGLAWANDDAYLVSGPVDQYQGVSGLLPPESGNRNKPIRGHAEMAPIPGCSGQQVINGTGVETSPTNRQVSGLVLEQMAANCSTAQYDHSHTIAVQRGNAKQDFPDGTGRGKIPATLQFGLGNAYGRPGPSGHDPVDDAAVAGDYLRDQDPLAKYGSGILSARGVLGPGENYGSGFPLEHQRSQFPTMGEDILAGFGPRETKPVSNRMLGQSEEGSR